MGIFVSTSNDNNYYYNYYYCHLAKNFHFSYVIALLCQMNAALSGGCVFKSIQMYLPSVFSQNSSLLSRMWISIFFFEFGCILAIISALTEETITRVKDNHESQSSSERDKDQENLVENGEL